MKKKLRVAVLASGRGSNFQVLIDQARAGRLGVDLVLLVSDRPGSGALERAERAGVPTFVAPRSEYETKKEMEGAILKALRESGAELVVLAGYMRLIGPELLAAYQGRMINLHPSLLPSFTGLDALGQALEAGVKVTGVTVHLVDEGLDTGPIVAQRAFAIPEGASREEVEEILHGVEHELLPEVVGLFAAGRIRREGRKVKVAEEGGKSLD